jgi:hypothetical protein
LAPAQAEESKRKSEKLVDTLKAILEETDLRIAGTSGLPGLRHE